jgi:hypothetical protein
MWEVTKVGVVDTSTNTIINWNQFELLTGRKRLSYVPDRTIVISRDKGHVHFHDTKFIQGERYKQNGNIYVCRVVSNEDGNGLFEPISKDLKVILTKDTTSLEIV